jgi:hypothetical protein
MSQIDILNVSLELRVLEQLCILILFPENGYQGTYIKDLARDYLAQKARYTNDRTNIGI